MKNSIKQLLRTPVKSALLFLIMTSCTALLVLGVNLWKNTHEKIEEVEQNFTTVGYVTQKESSTRISGWWDAGMKTYFNFEEPVFDSVIADTVLDFAGANYIGEPEHRPYYSAWMPEYKSMFAVQPNTEENIIAEFTVLENCIPSEPVRVELNRVLYGNMQNSETFLFCDHLTEFPGEMQAGKTYIAWLHPRVNTHENPEHDMELISGAVPESTQCASDGTLLASDVNYMENPPTWEEVTDDFYETGRGIYWTSLAEALARMDESFPVLPTDDLQLLPTFHEQQSYVVEGREITEEEFNSGSCVCLLPDLFASANNLGIGDKIKLPLYMANYKDSASVTYPLSGVGSWSFGLVNAEGHPYDVFWEAEYEIVGLYRTDNTGTLVAGTSEIGRDTFIIPAGSVTVSDENNIAYYGPMSETTTAFQIPNGSAAEFMEAFEASGPESTFLNVRFDDNGYEQVVEGLNNTRYIAILLFLVGLLSTLLIVILSMYFFIVKQKKRMAIERSLGMSKRQCRVSIISGFLLLCALAILIGCMGSILLLDEVEKLDLTGQEESTFNIKYSSWASDDAVEYDFQESTDHSAELGLGIGAMLMLVITVLAITIHNTCMKIDPILLLNSREI